MAAALLGLEPLDPRGRGRTGRPTRPPHLERRTQAAREPVEGQLAFVIASHSVTITTGRSRRNGLRGRPREWARRSAIARAAPSAQANKPDESLGPSAGAGWLTAPMLAHGAPAQNQTREAALRLVETGPPMYETHHIGQLIPWVDRTFGTIADRSGRVSAELSMGSFGAMSYAARHPHMFSAAVAFAGAVEPVDPDRLEG